ncbi:MAG: hypothetical protein Q8L16_00480 [Hydrogenophaga sp.]|nr:hypothetical protein [Hydrogenophaga sp.]
MNKLPALFTLCALSSLAAGCSTQTAYYSGQGWQRQQCFKIEDMQQRQRCLKSASTSHEDYQREVEALPTRP